MMLKVGDIQWVFLNFLQEFLMLVNLDKKGKPQQKKETLQTNYEI
jgi:hypothetical protein